MKLKNTILVSTTLIFVSAIIGCGTVTTKEVAAQSPDFVGNKQDSGVRQWKAGGSYVDQEWIKNYNTAISIYGADPYFKHVLKSNEGITFSEGGHAFATDEAHEYYAMMQSWRRSGTHQPKSILQKIGL